MLVIETERLILRQLNAGDASFMLSLLNDPSWIKYIGDRNINTIEEAKDHIEKKYISSYNKNGFGLYLVELKDKLISIGVCGLINRPSLEDVDIGFAFMPEYTGSGYAYEAAKATMAYGYEKLNLERIVAITIAENERSINLLKKLGLRNSGNAGIPDDADCILFVPC